MDEEKKQPYIAWELETFPGLYNKPRCNEFIDRQTLTHVICNVNRPDDVSVEAFHSVMNAIAETLELFPYLKATEPTPIDIELLEGSGFEI